MDDIFSGIGGNISENEVAFGSMANTEIKSTFTSDPRVVAMYESYPKADLNTPWYQKALNSTTGIFSDIGNFFSGTMNKIILVLALSLILYVLLIATRRK